MSLFPRSWTEARGCSTYFVMMKAPELWLHPTCCFRNHIGCAKKRCTWGAVPNEISEPDVSQGRGMVEWWSLKQHTFYTSGTRQQQIIYLKMVWHHFLFDSVGFLKINKKSVFCTSTCSGQVSVQERSRCHIKRESPAHCLHWHSTPSQMPDEGRMTET